MPLQPIRNGDTMDEWRDKINDVVAHLNHQPTVPPPGHHPRGQYVKNFSASEWRKYRDGFYRLKILPNEHRLGPYAMVSQLLSKSGEKYSSVLFSWKTYVDGTVVILSQIIFNGKIILERGM